MDVEERLRDELSELADWLVNEPQRAGDGQLAWDGARAGRWPLVAAACVLIVAGVLGTALLVINSGGDTDSTATSDLPLERPDQRSDGSATEPLRLVLEGETLLSESPLVVAAAPPPELAVVDEAWGKQVLIEPMTSLDAAFEAHSAEIALRIQEPERDLELVKTTLVGRIDGEPWAIQILEGPTTLAQGTERPVLRIRSISSPNGGGSASGEIVDGSTLASIAPVPVADAPQPTGVGYSTPDGWLTWDRLPTETAVVTFEDADERLWTQPVAGLAALPVELHPGERFTVQALDPTGAVLWTVTQVAEGAPPPPELTGQDLDAVLGPGLDARQLVASSTNGYTIIAVGASWCVPCLEDLDEIRRVLQPAADSGAAIVSIDASGSGEAFWPARTDWPFERFRAPDSDLKTNVGALPTFLLVDANLNIVAATLGTDGLKVIADMAQN